MGGGWVVGWRRGDEGIGVEGVGGECIGVLVAFTYHTEGLTRPEPITSNYNTKNYQGVHLPNTNSFYDNTERFQNIQYPKATSPYDNNESLKGIHIPELDYLCVNPDVKGGCEHCYFGYNCIDGEAYVNVCKVLEESCTDDRLSTGDCVPNGAPNAKEDCKPNAARVYADYFNNSFFHYCNTYFAIQETYMCQNETYFHEATGTCESIPPTLECKTPIGIYTTNTSIVNPSNCHQYYTCLPGDEIELNTCPNDDHYFNEDGNMCDPSCKVKTETENRISYQLCASESMENDRDPFDCNVYYLCLDIPIQQKCLYGDYFDVDVNKCVSGPLPPECTLFNYSLCPGYDQIEIPCPSNNSLAIRL
ncbi:hypothetical protein Pcinc_038852 [Petrolisthes cinctipes]|uniref:Chitin-binding type-2 domain-containing protein n=1 Tax=Petrolisthes cinctipes TaxID=88211 RepID=A0AAE1BSU8_PETCI|nr:hypothetical protein Pcinc_038852 [Petrolisthes cinctipes]